MNDSSAQMMLDAVEKGTRFGVAAGLLGLDGSLLGPWIEALGPELTRRFAVGLDGELAAITLLAEGRAGGDGELADRLGRAASAYGCHREAAWFGHRLLRPGVTTLGARLEGTGVSLSLEERRPRPLEEVVAELTTGPPPRLEAAAADQLLRLGRHLKEQCDTVANESRHGTPLLRLGLLLKRGAARHFLPPVMEALGVGPAQRSYFLNTLDALAADDGELLVRLAATEGALLPEVAVAYSRVPVPLLLPIWKLFSPLPDLARRVGALVGALGTEIADELELRFRQIEPPQIAVTL